MQEDGNEVDEAIDEEMGLMEMAKTLKKPRQGFRFNERKFIATRTLENGELVFRLCVWFCKVLTLCEHKTGILDDGIPTFYFKAQGGGGATLCITERSVILGTWEDGKQTAPQCNEAVESLARHLKQHKY